MNARADQQTSVLVDIVSGLSTLRACLVTIVEYLETQLQKAMTLAFQGDDEAYRYVTAPLLERQGPLGDMMVKARLLVALGRLEPTVFDDLETLIRLRDQTLYSPSELAFTSPEVLAALGQLHHFDASLLPMFEQRLALAPEEPEMRHLYMATINAGVRSALTLAVTTLEAKILGRDD